MGENFDKIQDPELKKAIQWKAKNNYIEELIVMLGQIEAGGDAEPLRRYAAREFEFIENACEGLAVMGNHPAILKDYQARNTTEARERAREREEMLQKIGILKQHPDYNKGSGRPRFLPPDEPGGSRGR